MVKIKAVKAKTVIDFTDATVKGYEKVFGEIWEKKVHSFIYVTLGNMEYNDSETQKVLKYCQLHYNYKMI